MYFPFKNNLAHWCILLTYLTQLLESVNAHLMLGYSYAGCILEIPCVDFSCIGLLGNA